MGPSCLLLKTSKQTRSVARKVCFISGAGKSGVWRVADICLKADSSRCLPFQTGGESFYRQSGRGGLHAETAQSSSNWLSMVWPAPSWLFSIQLIFSSRAHLFPFLCGHFSDWGSSCPGYSLVTMYLTSPPGVSVSIRQLTGYGSEYYL